MNLFSQSNEVLQSKLNYIWITFLQAVTETPTDFVYTETWKIDLLLYQVYLYVGAEFLDLSRASISMVTFPSGKNVPLQLLSQGANSVVKEVLITHVDAAYSL